MEKHCSLGKEISTSFVGDSCILKYAVVMYHLITNNSEIYLYAMLFLLIIILNWYQCLKIWKLINSYYSIINMKKYILIDLNQLTMLIF